MIVIYEFYLESPRYPLLVKIAYIEKLEPTFGIDLIT